VTDPSDPLTPKNSRRKPNRQPATIDVRPTVIADEAAAPDPSSTEMVSVPAAPSEPEVLAGETLEGDPARDPSKNPFEAPTDGGASVDSISGAGGEPPREPPEAHPASPPPRDVGFGRLASAAVLGGLIGAGIMLGVQAFVPSANDNSRITALEERITALGASPDQGLAESINAADRRARLAVQIARRANERAKQVAATPPPAPAPAPDGAAVEQLASRLENVQQEVVSTSQAATGSVQELRQQLDDQNRQVAALSQRLSEGPSAATKAGLSVILADRVTTALDSGSPYAETLTVLRTLRGDDPALATLTPFADKGAPTAQALAEEFRPIGVTIIRDSRSGAAGWQDRLWRMLDKVVTVRPVDEPGSTSASSLVARIESALERGDVRGAFAAWEQLPEPSRRLSEDWGKQVEARARADAAAQMLASSSLAALNSGSQ
jgi:hypothetical protein